MCNVGLFCTELKMMSVLCTRKVSLKVFCFHSLFQSQHFYENSPGVKSKQEKIFSVVSVVFRCES